MSKQKNKSVTVTKDFDVEYSPRDKNAFSKYIKEKRVEFNDENGKNISTKELGKMVGIDYEMFRKILNQQKPTKKRDCIIAICVALQLLPGEIDEALNLYQYMPALDEQNPRDMFIMEKLKAHVTVAGLNAALIKTGFPGLDIQDKRNGNKKKDSVTIKHPATCKIMEMKVRTPVAEYYHGDPYDSLCTLYDPYNYKETGDMVIKDIKNKKYVHLVASNDGTIFSEDLNGEWNHKNYKNLDEAGEYKSFFQELQHAVMLERKRLLNILNDTRNYQVRTSARLIEDEICVFSERFNYSLPEMNEYYLMRLSKGKYKLFVYNESAFMSWYLSEKTFKACYGGSIPKAIETYESVQQIEQLLADKDRYSDDTIKLQMRKRAFESLQKNVDDMYEGLKNGKILIQSLDYIYDNPYDVLRYYNLEKDYECKYDEEYPEIIGCLPSKEYYLPGGGRVDVTLEDIQHAFELGYESIEQICELKAKLGSVEAVL